MSQRFEHIFGSKYSRDAGEVWFPLRGRWRRYAFRAILNAFLLAVVMLCLDASSVLARLASAQNLRVKSTSQWRLAEMQGNFTQAGAPFCLQVGPVRLDYWYPARGRRSIGEPLIRIALFCLIVGTPFVVARKLLGAASSRWAWGFGGALGVLTFPVATACGPMGCQGITTWHCMLQWVAGAG